MAKTLLLEGIAKIIWRIFPKDGKDFCFGRKSSVKIKNMRMAKILLLQRIKCQNNIKIFFKRWLSLCYYMESRAKIIWIFFQKMAKTLLLQGIKWQNNMKIFFQKMTKTLLLQGIKCQNNMEICFQKMAKTLLL